MSRSLVTRLERLERPRLEARRLGAEILAALKESRRAAEEDSTGRALEDHQDLLTTVSTVLDDITRRRTRA